MSSSRARLHEMRARRPFARDDEQRIGTALAQAHEHAQQEVDVLFVGHAAHVEQQRPVGGQMPKRCAKARAVAAARKLSAGNPVGNTSMGVFTP